MTNQPQDKVIMAMEVMQALAFIFGDDKVEESYNRLRKEFSMELLHDHLGKIVAGEIKLESK